MHQAVRTCSDRSGLVPQKKVTAGDLEAFFIDVCREADKELLAEAKCAAVLLPDSDETGVPNAHRDKVKSFLDETRDYLDSPQFLSVFQATTTSAARFLTNLLGDGAIDPGVAPLSGGKDVPLAKLFGQLIEFSQPLLSEDGSSDLAAKFAEHPVVVELCHGLYFQESEASKESGRI